MMLCLNPFYSQTCFGLLHDQLKRIKISNSHAEQLKQMLESSFYRVQAKITYKEADANILIFSGIVESHTGQKPNGHITFNLLHPAGKDFLYDVEIKNGKFYDEFFTEYKFLPAIYLWKATVALESASFTNELFFIMEIKGSKKMTINSTTTKKDNSIINGLEYIQKIDEKQNKELVTSLKNLELHTKGLYYFIYLLHRLIELTNETAYLVRLINKDKKTYIHLKKYIKTAQTEYKQLWERMSYYTDKNLWEKADNTIPTRLVFLKNYYDKVYEKFKKIKENMEEMGKTFEISILIIEQLSKILW